MDFLWAKTLTRIFTFEYLFLSPRLSFSFLFSRFLKETGDMSLLQGRNNFPLFTYLTCREPGSNTVLPQLLHLLESLYTLPILIKRVIIKSDTLKWEESPVGRGNVPVPTSSFVPSVYEPEKDINKYPRISSIKTPILSVKGHLDTTIDYTTKGEI